MHRDFQHHWEITIKPFMLKKYFINSALLLFLMVSLLLSVHLSSLLWIALVPFTLVMLACSLINYGFLNFFLGFSLYDGISSSLFLIISCLWWCNFSVCCSFFLHFSPFSRSQPPSFYNSFSTTISFWFTFFCPKVKSYSRIALAWVVIFSVVSLIIISRFGSSSVSHGIS